MTSTDACIVPQEGHRNTDGYVRVLDAPRPQGGKLNMLHRMEWEKTNGPVPSGHNINHLCKNRECANVNHMEVLTLSEHATKDNGVRYKEREDRVVAHFMLNPETTQRALADLFGLTQSAINSMLNRRIQND